MSIVIYEPRQELEVETPKGRGRIWLVTEYGTEIEKVFTVILNNGLIWEFTNKDALTLFSDIHVLFLSSVCSPQTYIVDPRAARA